MKTSLTLLFAALVLAGCASTASVEPQPVNTPAQWKAAVEVTKPAAAQAAWWHAFGDAELTQLVQRALVNSPTVQAAAARLAQAQALAGQARAAQLPQAGLSAGGQRAGNAQGAANSAQIGAQLSYEIDLFGRLAGTRNAAQQNAQAQFELLRQAQLLLQADVAQTYLQLRALDRENALVMGTAASYRDALRLTERRVQAGEVAELDLQRLRAEAAGTDAEGAQIAQRRALLENLLALLVGEPPAALQVVARADWQALPAIPAGLPSQLLQRRPDLAASQLQLQAAQSRLGVANTAWFPQLALTAKSGFASSDLSELLKSGARNWGIGALLSLPLLDGGARQAAVDGAKADAELAAAQYRQQVLQAFKDVEDQLATLQSLQLQAKALAEAVNAADRAVTLGLARERNGLSNSLERLDAQRTHLRQQRAALQVQAAQAQATVGLVRALGGVWQAQPAASS